MLALSWRSLAQGVERPNGTSTAFAGQQSLPATYPRRNHRSSTNDCLHMSSCPRRYASKSIRVLRHSHLPSSVPEPLWFLYPRWSRLDLSHRYHTEHAHGQDRLCSHRRKEICRSVSSARPVSKHGHCRYYHSTKRTFDQSPSQPTQGPHSDGRTTKKPDNRVERTILHKDLLFRKIVPQTTWIPKRQHFPRQEVLERRAHYIRQINPSTLLSILRSIPSKPLQPSKGSQRVNLSDFAQHELMPDITKDNTWRHYDGSGCTVTFRRGHIELYGTERAQEIALKYFSDDQHCTRSQQHFEWYEGALHGSYLPIRDLPQPPTWTVRSLIDYVTLVTRPRFRRSAQRLIYEDDESHHQAVFKILQDIFTNPLSCPFVSTLALRLALSYCRRHTEFPTTAHGLWTAFLRCGLHPDIACYNEELGRCLVGKELNRFCRLVLEMKNLGIQPDSTTWAVVTAYTERRSSRAAILRLAMDKDLSKLHQHESLTIATAEKEIESCPGTQDGVQRFMERMKDQFGGKWLTSRVLKAMLRVCRVGRARMGLTSELLLAVKRVGNDALVDQECVIELIQISSKAGNLHDALELVKNKTLSRIADIPQIVIDVLFSMAWQRKYFNLCRYFWFLGATSGRITYKMQDLVAKSLKSNVSNVEDPLEASWQLLAGKIIVGTNLDAQGFAGIFPNLSKSKRPSSPIEWLLDWTPDGALRSEQVQLGQLLIERDLHAFRFYQRLRRETFVKLLDEALALDEEWKNANAATTMSPRDLVGGSVKIPLERRTEILKYAGRSKEEGRCWFIVNDHRLNYDTLQYDEDVCIEAKTIKEVSNTQEKGVVGLESNHSQESRHWPVSARDEDNSQMRNETALESDTEERRVVWQGLG